MALGMACLTLLPTTVSNPWIMAGMFLTGLGFGLFQTPNNRAMLSSAPRQRSGAAGGVQATTRVFGQSFGTALVAIAFSVYPSTGPRWPWRWARYAPRWAWWSTWCAAAPRPRGHPGRAPARAGAALHYFYNARSAADGPLTPRIARLQA